MDLIFLYFFILIGVNLLGFFSLLGNLSLEITLCMGFAFITCFCTHWFEFDLPVNVHYFSLFIAVTLSKVSLFFYFKCLPFLNRLNYKAENWTEKLVIQINLRIVSVFFYNFQFLGHSLETCSSWEQSPCMRSVVMVWNEWALLILLLGMLLMILKAVNTIFRCCH